MVSFTLDTVKFILIYRYLQNTYWFRRGTTKYHALYCPRAFTPSQISSVLSELSLIAHIRTILIVSLLTWHESENEQHNTTDIRDKA